MAPKQQQQQGTGGRVSGVEIGPSLSNVRILQKGGAALLDLCRHTQTSHVPTSCSCPDMHHTSRSRSHLRQCCGRTQQSWAAGTASAPALGWTTLCGGWVAVDGSGLPWAAEGLAGGRWEEGGWVAAPAAWAGFTADHTHLASPNCVRPPRCCSWFYPGFYLSRNYSANMFLSTCQARRSRV